MATWRRWQYQVYTTGQSPPVIPQFIGGTTRSGGPTLAPTAVPIASQPFFTDGVLGKTEEPGPGYESQWHQPYTDPQVNFAARVRAVASVALMAASGLFAPVLSNTQEPGNSYESTYHQPWSEPVRLKPRAAYFETTTSGYNANLEPGAYQPWYQPWADPVKLTKPRPAHFDFTTSGYDNTLEPGAYIPWYASLSEPVRVKPRAAYFETTTTGYTATVEPGAYEPFFEPWTDPVKLTKPRAPHFDFTISGYDSTLEPGATYEAPWHFPWSEPVRVKPRDAYFEFTTSGYNATIEPGAYQPWYFPWSEPVRIAPAATSRQQFWTGPQTSEAIFADKWAPQYPDFAKTKPRAADYPALIHAPFNEDFSIEAKWHYPWSEPTRVKPAFRVGTDFLPYVPFAFTVEQITVDKWFANWREPVRVKPGLLATEQQFLAFDPQPFVKIDWYNWLNEPKRFLAGLPTTEQQSFTAGFVPIIPSVTNWFEPLNEPVRFRTFGVQHQQALSWSPQNITSAVIRFARGYIIC